MEIRGTNTTMFRVIGLIESGTGLVKGQAEIYDSFEIDRSQFMNFEGKHLVPSVSEVKYKRIFGWCLKDIIPYETPVRYLQVDGQQVWVRLCEDPDGSLTAMERKKKTEEKEKHKAKVKVAKTAKKKTKVRPVSVQKFGGSWISLQSAGLMLHQSVKVLAGPAGRWICFILGLICAIGL